jgi:glutathionylspermidine synthase
VATRKKKTSPKKKPKSKAGNGAALPPAPGDPATALRIADQELVEWMRANPGEVQKQRQETLMRLQKKRCSYGRHGGGLPLTLVPMVLTKESVELIRRVSEVLDRASDKVINAYVQDPKVREWFPYPDVPHEWIMWDPGFPKPTVISRHDAIYDGKNLKFIEFNTDNPGARAWADHYEQVFKAIPMYAERLGKHWKPAERPMLRRMLEIFQRYHDEYGRGKGKPRVALSTFKEYLPGSELDIIRDYLIEHGMEANFIDSRDFEYRGGKLLSGNVPFDILHICLRFTFFKRFPREHRDFFEAIKNRACLTINPFRAAIGSQKEGMAFMTNPENHHWFDAEEVEAIQKHIPWTRRMDETVTISPEGRDISLMEFALKEKERLVLKITTGAGGQEVYVGKSCDRAKWEDAVEYSSGCPWWILQEACDIPEWELPVLDDGEVKLEKKLVNVNPYLFDGEYAGSVARVSTSSVINVAAGGGIMPVFEEAR